MAVNKCNITEYTLELVNSVRYGIKFTSQNKILENYIQSLECDTVDIVPCYPDDCTNETTIINCNALVIGDIASEVDEDNNGILFYIED